MNTDYRGWLLLLVALVLVTSGCSVAQPPSTLTTATAPAALPADVTSPVAPTPPAGPECVRATSYPILPVGADSSTVDTIRKSGRLRVGISLTAYGLTYRDPLTQQMSGFEVDIVNAIATALFGTDQGTVDWVSVDPSGWIAALTGQKPKGQTVPAVDMVLGAMTMTCERWNEWDFSTEYLNTKQRMLVRNSSPIKDMADVRGRKVCSSSGSTNMAELTGGAFPQRPIIVGVNDETDCMLLLQQDKIDALFTDDVVLAELAAQDRTVKLLPPDPALNLPDEPAAIGVPKSADHGLTRFVNGVLAQFRGDGQADQANSPWEKSYTTWLAASLGPESPPTPAYLGP